MGSDPLLVVRGLGKTFTQRTWWGGAGRRPRAALGDVSFSLERGHTFGLVGPSGSGKSTLARCISLFESPTSGEILWEGRNLWGLDVRERRKLRPEIQIIFQEPASSLNPRFTAAEIIEEPLRIQGRGTARERDTRARELLETVGLRADAAHKHPLEFSGGERQRLAIARALALTPKLLILDESFSGLDFAVQAQLMKLLLELQNRLALSYLLISHDLSAVANLADEIAVMDGGRIVEKSSTAALLANPQHPRTQELVEADRALRLQGAEA